jgi:hypothetical protein
LSAGKWDYRKSKYVFAVTLVCAVDEFDEELGVGVELHCGIAHFLHGEKDTFP